MNKPLDKTLLWLWLSLLFGPGSRIYRDVIAHFDSIQDAYDSDDGDMSIIRWLSSSEKNKFLDKNLDHAYEVMDWCLENDIKIITCEDEIYPNELKKLLKLPAVLYCKGELPNFNEELSISLVGTRSMTAYGQKMAYDLGYTLSKGGAITVSGMARGVDSTVALGTLNAMGRTVAVLGCGIDIVYPRENTELMKRIADNGAVITEYPPHSPPNSWHFPIRNRIISAISNGTVVVEAPYESGSLITARQAIDLGKPVFAVPGPAKFHSTKGTNALISEGKAKMARDALDILEEFIVDYRGKIDFTKAKMRPTFSKNALKISKKDIDREEAIRKNEEVKKSLRKEARKFEEILETPKEIALDPNIFSEEQIKIYNFMQYGVPTSVDELVKKTDISASNILSTLMMLAVEGVVDELPGGFFIKN